MYLDFDKITQELNDLRRVDKMVQIIQHRINSQNQPLLSKSADLQKQIDDLNERLVKLEKEKENAKL